MNRGRFRASPDSEAMTFQEKIMAQIIATPICLHTLPQVEARVGLKKTKIYDMMKEGTFPRPIKVEGRRLWPNTVIDQWIEELVEKNTAGGSQ